MRKIVYMTGFDEQTFSPHILIKMLEENGKITELFKEEITFIVDQKYTPEQQAKINQINNVLVANGLGPLTEEESDWTLDPNAYKAYMQETLNEEQIQRLAGFKVEKKITYFDDFHKEEK